MSRNPRTQPAALTLALALGLAALAAWRLTPQAPASAQAGADLYLKDSPLDSGAEPNPDPGPMWVTEDIWVRSSPDPGYRPEPFPESSPSWTPLAHQSPEYRDPRLGLPNYVYVRVRNRGTAPSTGSERLRLYWAKASTGLGWNTQWVDYMAAHCGPTALYGMEVTKPRLNAATASKPERDAYRDAILAIGTDPLYQFLGGMSYWHKQDEVHQFGPGNRHGTLAFLPWHRELVNRYELLLQEANPLVKLLYWDWTTDPESSTGGFNLFSGDFMGASGKGTGGASAGLPFMPALSPPAVTRNLGSAPTSVGDATLLALANYFDFSDDLEDGPHNGSHGYIGGGGNMSSIGRAAEDPFFFLLHTNADRLWAQWQRDPAQLGRLRAATAYDLSQGNPNLSTAMAPWNGAGTPIQPWTVAGGHIVSKAPAHASVVSPPIYDSAPLTVPPLAPGEAVVLQLPWYPPDPADYGCFGADQGHVCLLARIETAAAAPFGMASPEGPDVNANTRANNNIAWRNITVVDNFAGPLGLAGLLVRNVFRQPVAASLRFAQPDEFGASFLDQGQIEIDLGPELFRRWRAGGGEGQGIAPAEGLSNTIRVLQPEARLINLRLDPGEAFPVTARFRLNRDYQPREAVPKWDLIQLGSPEDGDAVVGGNRFWLDFRELRPVPAGASWRYLDTGEDPGPGWAAPDFDDRRWRSGRAALGYGHDPATTLDGGPPEARHVTTYFRHAFELPDPARFRDLLLRLRRADGAAVYLNGTLIHRVNLPRGIIAPDMLAEREVSGLEARIPLPVRVDEALGLLRPGRNVLAVEVHVASRRASALAFDLELAANLADRRVAPAVAFQAPGDGALLLAGRPVTVRVEALDGDGQPRSVALFADGMPIGLDEEAPYTFEWSGASPGAHRLRALATDDQRVQGAAEQTVTVVDNLPPTARLTAPRDGAMFMAGEAVAVTAEASDEGGAVARVDYHLRDMEGWFTRPRRLVGSATTAPFAVTLGGLAPGEYALTATAVDDRGAAGPSLPVHFHVHGSAAGTAAVFLPMVLNNHAPAPPRRPAAGLVRGLVALRVGEGPGARDLYVPDLEVTLQDLATGAEVDAVRTDLSGRFTLLAPLAGAYAVCWRGRGYSPACRAEPVRVPDEYQHVGTLRATPSRAGPDETHVLVYGELRLGDGSIPRVLEPLANTNVFATVALRDAAGALLDMVPVNNDGLYILPQVPVRTELLLAGVVEGATVEQRVLPSAGLHRAAQHAIHLRFANRPPRLAPLHAADASGRRPNAVAPGASLTLRARASDPDGDPVAFRWLAGGGAGQLSAESGETVTWTLPVARGRYALTLLAYDGKGGYARSTLSLRADALGVPFSGTVLAPGGAPVAGARVTVNGRLAVTTAEGFFRLRVPDGERFVLSVRAPGFGLLSQVHGGSVTGGRWTLNPATVVSVDPASPIDVTDNRGPRNCPGPDSYRLDWRQYPNLARPEWQDGAGRVVPPRGELGLPLPSDPEARPPAGRCGPGARLRIPANALVDDAGNPPAGNVELSIATVDLLSPGQMPGDFTVDRGRSDSGAMQSFGAAMVEISAGPRSYNLRPGSLATLEIPVDPTQLAAGQPPATVPILFYDEAGGVWREEGEAVLSGSRYVAELSHFSSINADLVFSNQSCVRVQSPSLPGSYDLEVWIPMGNGAPKVLKQTIDNAAQQTHVVINLPSNVDILLVPIRTDLGSPIPMGMFVVNTGGPQNPTQPALPAFPYDACATEVLLQDNGQPPSGFANQFLHGLYSFAASNLTELQQGSPTQQALATALAAASADYYAQVDPRGKRQTLAGFKATNQFGAGDLHAIYGNSGDLGFGRDMHCTRFPASDGLEDSACYVTNYGNLATDDQADVNEAVDDALNGTGNPVATVAMEYSRVESLPGNLVEYDDPERVVKFFVYSGDGSTLLGSAELDGHGERPVPQLCMVCHGGQYPGGATTGVPGFASRDDVKLDARFLPFDLRLYTFAGAPWDKAGQQAAFKAINEDIVAQSPPDAPSAAIQELIAGFYQAGPTQDEQVVVPQWQAQPGHQTLYRDVMAPACRTCHVANSFPNLRFDAASQVIDILGAVEQRVCVDYKMPHAQRTFDIFWQSVGPHMPAQLQAFGQAFHSPTSGWSGQVCGPYTAGGGSPASAFDSQVQPIFSANCVGCHVGGSPPANLNLGVGMAHGQLVNKPATQLPGMDRVEPSDKQASYLWHKVNGSQATVGGGGNAMPPPGGGLAPADLAAIEAWISAGAAP